MIFKNPLYDTSLIITKVILFIFGIALVLVSSSSIFRVVFHEFGVWTLNFDRHFVLSIQIRLNVLNTIILQA